MCHLCAGHGPGWVVTNSFFDLSFYLLFTKTTFTLLLPQNKCFFFFLSLSLSVFTKNLMRVLGSYSIGSVRPWNYLETGCVMEKHLEISWKAMQFVRSKFIWITITCRNWICPTQLNHSWQCVTMNSSSFGKLLLEIWRNQKDGYIYIYIYFGSLNLIFWSYMNG